MVLSGINNQMLTDMKKTIKFFAAALAVVTAACGKIDSDISFEEDRIEFNYEVIDVIVEASLTGPVDPNETRTALAPDGISVHWTNGDQINMFPFKGTGHNDPSPYEGNGYLLKVDASTISGGSAQFTGTAVNADTYRAIYPASSLNSGSCWGDDYVFYSSTLKSQTVVENNFPQTTWGCTNISMAFETAKGDVLHFKNQMAYIKFSVNEPNIYSIHLSADKASYGSDRTLSNTGNIGGTLHYRPVTGKFDLFSDDPITLSNNEQPFSVGKTYYVAIPPVTMEGFSMECKDANGNNVVGKTKQSQFTAESNHIYNIGALGSATVGEDISINPVATAEHIKDFNGNIIRTDIKMSIQASDASKIKDFSFTASLSDCRTLSTSNPRGSDLVMEIANDNYYVSGGSTGYRNITCSYSVNGNHHEKVVQVKIEKPDFTLKTEFNSGFTYYLNGNAVMANNFDAYKVNLTRAVIGIDSQITSKTNVSYKVEFNGVTYTENSSKYSTYNLNKEILSLPVGKHLLKTTATFDGIEKVTEQWVYITGLPYKDYKTTLYSNQETTVPNIYIPEDINVDINLDAVLVGYNGKSYITYTLYLGSETFAETTHGYDASQTKPYVLNGKDVVLKANSSIKMESSVNDNYNDKYVQVNDFDILYR